MDIQILKYFKYVAVCKNITKAAEHFYISQSTLSRYISNLEEELGVVLFNRNNRILSLTPAGEALANNVDMLIEHLEQVIRKVQSANEGEEGRLHLISIGNVGGKFDACLQDFLSLNPTISLTVEEYDVQMIEDAIKYNLFDAALTIDSISTMQNTDTLTSIPITEECFALACPKYIEDKDDFMTLDHNLSLALPYYTDPPIVNLWKDLLRDHPNLNKKIEYLNSTNSVILHVKNGFNYSIVPSVIITHNYNLDNINLIPLYEFIDNAPKSNIILLYNQNSTNAVLKRFIEFLKESLNLNT